MRLVIQRVSGAAVTVESGERREIGPGLLVLFGAAEGDELEPVGKLADKTAKMRIFSDADDKMNLSALDLGLSVLVISQFTLFADTRKGQRPSFTAAARPPFAREAYEAYVEALRQTGIKEVKTGEFGDMMKVELVNDGPVTIIVDTKEWKK